MMARVRWREQGDQFNYWIRGVLDKEMVLAHSSYARAAGIQSEINKVTVTRVAGSEVEYQRQMSLHRKNMEFVVRNIRKEQTKLRKSIAKYSTKLREGRRNRERREKEERLRDQKSYDNVNQMSTIFVVRDHKPVLTTIRKSDAENENISPDSGIGGSDDGRAMDSEEKRPHSENHNVKTDKERTDLHLPSLGATLPSIMEDNEQGEEEDLEKRNDFKHETTLPEISLNNELETKLNSHLRTIKPKKQGVSFSDLIKLQHSTNTKKLFNLVNILAQKHGLKDIEDKQEKENRNSSILRGSTDESMSLKAASVLYPMKYGYDSGTELESEMSIPILETERQSLFEGTFDLQEGNQEVLSAHNGQRLDNLSPEKSDVLLSPIRSRDPTVLSPTGRNRRRNKSLPMLMDEYQSLKFNQSLNVPDEPRRGSSLVKSPKPRMLPPIQKQKSEETYLTRSQRSNSISWTAAFGLLKGVHSLLDQ